MANTAAEFNLLAGLCRHPDIYFEFAEFLSTEDFTQKTHKQLFVVIQKLLLDASSDEEIIVTEGDILAKASELNLNDFYSSCDDGELIQACIQHHSAPSDVVRSFKQVKRETVKRVLRGEVKGLEKYLGETTDEIDRLIAQVEDRIIGATTRLQGVAESPIIKLSDCALDILEELAEKPGQLGLDIGLPTWQRAIGGIRNGAVTFIAASTKQGKSQLGVRAALEIAKLGIPTLICDSELNKVAQAVRAFGQFAEVDYEVWETGYWKAPIDEVRGAGYDDTFIKSCQVAKRNITDPQVRQAWKSLPLFYHSINGASARESIPFLRRWVMQHVGINPDNKAPRCLIVWDYIKLAHIEEVKKLGVGAHDLLQADCSALHDFAEHYNLPILAFGQTNRELDVDLGCIAGAKKITELVDSVSLFKRKSNDELMHDPNGSHLIRSFVSRYGKGLNSHVNIVADLSIGKFQDLGVSSPRAAPPQPTRRDNDTDDEDDDE